MTVEELTTIIEHIEDDGIIDKDKSELLQLTLEFSDIFVSEVITPRRDMVAIDIDEDEAEIMETILSTTFSRLPVYEDDIDNIIGILHVGHLFERLIDRDNDNPEDIHEIIRAIIQKPVFIFETKKLFEVFNVLNAKQMPMAIVVDEYGGITGCVTVEDIVEELVGDIWDEYDIVEDSIKKIGDGTYEVSGDISLREFAQELDIDRKLVESEYNTVGGWLIERYKGLPEVGDAFRIENLYVKVLAINSHRVETVLVCILDFDIEEE